MVKWEKEWPGYPLPDCGDIGSELVIPQISKEQEEIINALNEISYMSFTMEHDELKDLLKRLKTGEAYENIWVYGG